MSSALLLAPKWLFFSNGRCFALEKNFELDLSASLPMVESGHEPVLSHPNLSP